MRAPRAGPRPSTARFVSARFLDLVKVVTTVTLAHSVTLSLAWFEIVDLPSRLVESLIALTSAYVAPENLFGLGFYGVLRELDLDGGSALQAGSLAILAVAGFWFVQRRFLV